MKIPFKFMQCAYLNSVNSGLGARAIRRFDAHNSFPMAGWLSQSFFFFSSHFCCFFFLFSAPLRATVKFKMKKRMTSILGL